MFNIIHGGKMHHLIQGYTPEANKEPNIIKRYHAYFRQRDTLKNIPKELEEMVKVKDSEAYESEVTNAAERVSALEESRTETLPIYDMNYFDNGEKYKVEEKTQEEVTGKSTVSIKKPKKHVVRKK